MEKIASFFKNTKPSGQLVGWCLLLLLGFILSAGIQLFFPASPYHTPTDIRIELLEQGLGQLFMFLLPAVLFAILFDGRPMQYLRVDFSGSSWALGLLAMLVMLLMTPLCDKLTVWNQQFGFGSMETALRNLTHQSQLVTDRLLSLTGVGDLLLQLLVIALVPALCEELFFRGCLQQLLCGWLRNKHVAICIAAAVFALAHGDAYGFLPRLLMGLLLGYTFYYSGSIVVSICAHFFNNALVVSAYYFYHHGVFATPPSEPLAISWFWVAMCAVGALLLSYQYFVKKGEKEHQN